MKNNGKENKVVVLFTQNTKLCSSLASALDDCELPVLRVSNIQEVHESVKNNNVGAVVLHVKDSNGWIIFEMIRTSYPNTPRFAILAPSLTGDDLQMKNLAQEYQAAAITNETGVKQLASLIASINTVESELSSKEIFLSLYAEIGRELLRLQREHMMTGLRTLPQPEIGKDTRKRMKSVLDGLKELKITP